jgi:WD40 repeat protein
MTALTNENLIRLIFRNFTLYDLQAEFDKIKNKIINQIRLKILSYDKIFKSMGRSKLILANDNKRIFQPVLLPNGNLLSASDGTILFWDMKSVLIIKTLTAEDKIYTFTVLENGNLMAYLYNAKFQVWNNHGEGPTRTIEVTGYNTLSNILFLSNGDIACIEEHPDDWYSLMILCLKDNYQSSIILDKREGGDWENIHQISNNLFYTCSEPDSLKIYDMNNDYECTFIIEERLRPSLLIGNFLFVTRVDIVILDIMNEYKCLYRLKGHVNCVSDLLYIEKNQFLLSGSTDRTIKVWDASNNYDCIRTIDTGGILKFLILKNGYFATTFLCDYKIRIWDSISFKCVNILKHDSYPYCIKLLEDNRILSFGRNFLLIWSY